MIDKKIIDNVTNQAYAFWNKVGGTPEDLQDMTQEALLAACEAEDAYEPERGAAFATYVFSVVERVLSDWKDTRQGSVVPVSRHYGKQIGRRNAIQARLQQELGREPRNHEIAAELGMSLAQYEALRSEADYEQVDMAAPEEDPFLDGDTVSFEDSIVGDGVLPGPEFVAETTELEARLAYELDRLAEQEKSILVALYERDLTLREAAEEFDKSHEWVRINRDRALRKLRARLPGEFAQVGTLSLEGRDTA